MKHCLTEKEILQGKGKDLKISSTPGAKRRRSTVERWFRDFGSSEREVRVPGESTAKKKNSFKRRWEAQGKSIENDSPGLGRDLEGAAAERKYIKEIRGDRGRKTPLAGN